MRRGGNMLDELKKILKDEGVNGRDLSDLLGINYGSYRTSTRTGNKNPPRWVRVFVVAYNLGKLSKNK